MGSRRDEGFRAGCPTEVSAEDAEVLLSLPDFEKVEKTLRKRKKVRSNATGAMTHFGWDRKSRVVLLWQSRNSSTPPPLTSTTPTRVRQSRQCERIALEFVRCRSKLSARGVSPSSVLQCSAVVLQVRHRSDTCIAAGTDGSTPSRARPPTSSRSQQRSGTPPLLVRSSCAGVSLTS